MTHTTQALVALALGITTLVLLAYASSVDPRNRHDAVAFTIAVCAACVVLFVAALVVTA